MATWTTLADWHMDNGDHMDGGWALVMVLFMLLVLGALVLLVVWLVRGTTPHATAPTRETPMDVLDRRLAAGEVTPDEYRERAELLRGS